MSTSLSDLADSLSEIYKKECYACMKRKVISKCNFIGFKDNRLSYKCGECGNRCCKLINEAIKNFPNMNQFCNGDLNKFVLLLRKCIYPNEYMDSCEMKHHYQIRTLFTAD